MLNVQMHARTMANVGVMICAHVKRGFKLQIVLKVSKTKIQENNATGSIQGSRRIFFGLQGLVLLD